MPIRWRSPEPLPGHRALVIAPEGETAGLPVLYLLHGQFDDESDWVSEQKGRLVSILESSCTVPMLIVLPFGGGENRSEPPLEELAGRLRAIQEAVARIYAPDRERQAILGISMGGKQALAYVLREPQRGGFSILGLLSGKFQQDNLNEVKAYAGTWPPTLGSELRLYFHYCGGAPSQDLPEGKRRTGDELFLASNRAVAADLAGGSLRFDEAGMHNWNFWRRELEEFFRAVSEAFGVRRP